MMKKIQPWWLLGVMLQRHRWDGYVVITDEVSDMSQVVSSVVCYKEMTV